MREGAVRTEKDEQDKTRDDADGEGSSSDHAHREEDALGPVAVRALAGGVENAHFFQFLFVVVQMKACR